MYIYYTDADSSQWVVATPTFAFQTLAENVTGVVAAANGGTGLTSPGASGNVLTSTGTGWQSQTAAMVPPGTIITYAGSTAPSGYLVADSAAVSRTTYAALFAVIGTTYGAGDGSTTFNLPNLVDRMPIGSGGLYALGATGGSKDAVVVEHTHAITDPGHRHQMLGDSDTVPDGGVGIGTDDGINVAIRTDAMNTAVTGVTINSTGVSGTNANLPPYIGQLYCIKF
jgi:microcystin-dependent protein